MEGPEGPASFAARAGARLVGSAAHVRRGAAAVASILTHKLGRDLQKLSQDTEPQMTLQEQDGRWAGALRGEACYDAV